MSDIIAMRRFINTTTDTNIYIPNTTLNKFSVHGGRYGGWFGNGRIIISSYVVCPNTAKNNNSKASNGFITTENKSKLHQKSMADLSFKTMAKTKTITTQSKLLEGQYTVRYKTHSTGL